MNQKIGRGMYIFVWFAAALVIKRTSVKSEVED